MAPPQSHAHFVLSLVMEETFNDKEKAMQACVKWAQEVVRGWTSTEETEEGWHVMFYIMDNLSS